MKRTPLLVRNFAVLLLVLLPRHSSAFDIRGILEGRIIDKETKEPLVGVNVQIVGTYHGGATDAGGYYEDRKSVV